MCGTTGCVRRSEYELLVRVIVADHLLAGDAPSREAGAVVLDDTDVVLAVGESSTLLALPDYARLPVTRIRGVVFPGLVNAHTHIELSALGGKVPGGGGFVAWVERLIAIRPEISADEESLAIAAAVGALVASGTVGVGEVTNSLVAARALAQAGLVGCIFHEVFGWDRERGVSRLAALQSERAERFPDDDGRTLAYAPSPHTVYTTHPDVVRDALAQAGARGALASLHLAEHDAEREAIESGNGEVAEWLARRAIDSGATAVWPRTPLFDYAESLGALRPDVLLVHLTCARPDELARVRDSGAQAVICPRSNLHIGGQLPPLRAMLDAGLAPALGTDSLASNASLDVLEEAACLHHAFADLAAWEVLKMATFNGARALGLPELGCVRPGARPGLVAVETTDAGDDAAAWLLEHTKAPRRVIARTLGGFR